MHCRTITKGAVYYSLLLITIQLLGLIYLKQLAVIVISNLILLFDCKKVPDTDLQCTVNGNHHTFYRNVHLCS